MNPNVNPEDFVYSSVDLGLDQSVLFRIKYIGSAASGTITIDATTGDITFKHGVLSSEVVDTDLKLDAGAVGVIDLSADVTDFHSLIRKINSSDNWEAWLVSALPDDDPEASGAGYPLVLAAVQAKVAGGLAINLDTSKIFYACASLTLNGPSSEPHGSDGMVYHELQRVIAQSTFASGTSLLTVYACNDVDGTKETILSLPTGATTVAVAYPVETSVALVEAFANGKRIVVKLLNSTAMTAVRLKIVGRSYPFGPAMRKEKLRSIY